MLLVKHRWDDGQWRREYRSPNESPALTGSAGQQLLLDGIRLERLRHIDPRGQAHLNWPVGHAPLSLPQAIELEFDAPRHPGLQRVILLPGFKGQEVVKVYKQRGIALSSVLLITSPAMT
ncbi:hypothetical protein [Pseudomonas sp. DWP1b1]|uniref:hypothetical protein n=1 Tax=unclassified Pseudomonas TaxID=196821 RepID=UPI003CE77DA3